MNNISELLVLYLYGKFNDDLFVEIRAFDFNRAPMQVIDLALDASIYESLGVNLIEELKKQ